MEVNSIVVVEKSERLDLKLLKTSRRTVRISHSGVSNTAIMIRGKNKFPLSFKHINNKQSYCMIQDMNGLLFPEIAIDILREVN